FFDAGSLNGISDCEDLHGPSAFTGEFGFVSELRTRRFREQLEHAIRFPIQKIAGLVAALLPFKHDRIRTFEGSASDFVPDGVTECFTRIIEACPVSAVRIV